MAPIVVSPLRPVPASGPGALDGWGFTCSCRGGQSASLESLARQWRNEHVRWHERRGEQVAA